MSKVKILVLGPQKLARPLYAISSVTFKTDSQPFIDQLWEQESLISREIHLLLCLNSVKSMLSYGTSVGISNTRNAGLLANRMSRVSSLSMTLQIQRARVI